MAKKFPSSFYCPTEFTLAVLGGKWKTVILCYLTLRPCRYSELRKLVPALSDKVLAERLRDLTSAGLVVRLDGGDQSSSAKYALTAKGRSLNKLLHQIYEWGHENAGAFEVKVGEPLKGLTVANSKSEPSTNS